jgi:hypothetical protein
MRHWKVSGDLEKNLAYSNHSVGLLQFSIEYRNGNDKPALNVFKRLSRSFSSFKRFITIYF